MTAAAIIARIEADLVLLREMLGAPAPAMPHPEPEEFLPPCLLAGRLGVGEAYARKLCERGLKLGVVGVERRGGRWVATVEALSAVRDGRV